jgi:transposase
MNKASSTLPDDPILLKQLLMSASVQMSEKDGQIEHLREQIALLTQRLFGRKPEQTFDPDSPQLEIFNETESHAEATPEAQADEVEEEVVAPVKRRGKASRCRPSCRASRSFTGYPGTNLPAHAVAASR